MDNDENIKQVLRDVVFMRSVGMRPVIIHGGGKAISAAMEDRGMEVQFVRGRRYTDSRALTVVEHVLCNEINNKIVNMLEDAGCEAMGLHTLSSCVLKAEKTFLKDGDRNIDIGLVGKIIDINTKLISLLCKAGTIPVIAPLAKDSAGQKYNCNADSAAGQTASSIVAEKFVCISDTHGIRQDVDDPDSTIASLSRNEIQRLIDDGTISSGMLPKVDACLCALDGGVKKTHIIDGRIQHALLLEIFSDEGVGTLVSCTDNNA